MKFLYSLFLSAFLLIFFGEAMSSESRRKRCNKKQLLLTKYVINRPNQFPEFLYVDQHKNHVDENKLKYVPYVIVKEIVVQK